MPQDGQPWTCPYCDRPTTLTRHNYDVGGQPISVKVSEHGEDIGVAYVAIGCPNPACKKLTLTVQLGRGAYPTGGGGWRIKELIQLWRILPESAAKPQPPFIPKSLRDDYVEACRIATLSPKASATLSRRCLQGMIRDFWKTQKKANLKQEIEAIEDRVDPGTWKAIDAVRSVGNIGAHMEQNIDLIIDVEPGEAGLLIELIETLFKEWYIARHEREERLEALVKLAAKKDKARKGEAVP